MFFFFFRFSVFTMEEITRSWNNLSLDEREGSRIMLKNTFRSSELSLQQSSLQNGH